ncbi:flap endonuclease, partial [Streptomyces albidoflavus]
VVRVAGDAPLPDFDPALPTSPRDPAALDALVKRWGLGGAVGRLLPVLER